MQYKVGMKQTIKMLEQHRAIEVYVAQDADPSMKERIVQLCKRSGVPIKWCDTMRSLGEICSIDVGAVTAALVRNEE